jgi:hypothetical protein
MPQVPIESAQLSMDVPSAPSTEPAAAGAVGAAIANLGAGVEQQAASILTQVKHAEAQNAASKAYFKDKLDTEQKITELKLSSPDGYVHEDASDPSSPVSHNGDGSPVTLTQSFHEWANQRFQDNQQNMPSELASQIYKEQALPHFSAQTAQLGTEVQQMKVKAFNDDLSNTADALGNSLVTNPDLKNYYSHTNDLSHLIGSRNGLMQNPTQGAEMTKKFNNELAVNMMNGAYTQILSKKKEGTSRLAEISAWRDVLAGRDSLSRLRESQGLPTLATMMDPKQRAIEEDKLIRLADIAGARDISDYREQFKQTEASLKSGTYNPGPVNSLLNQTIQYAKSGDLAAADASDRIARIFAARSIGRYSGPAFDVLSYDNKLAMMNNAEMEAKLQAQNFAKKMGLKFTEDMGTTAALTIEDSVRKDANAVEEEKAKDFAAFSQRVLPSGDLVAHLDHSSPIGLANSGNPKVIQQALRDSQALAKTASSNHPEYWRPMTKPQGQNYANFLQNPNISGEQAGQGIKALAKAYGPYYPKLIDQMIRDKNLDEKWRIAAIAGKESDTTLLVSSLRGDKVVEKNFKDHLLANNINEKDIAGYVPGLTGNWIASQIQASPYNLDRENFTDSVNTTVKNAAMQIFNIRGGTGISDYQKAAKDAYDQLIGNHVQVGDPNKGWFHSGVQDPPSIPKNFGGHNWTDSDMSQAYSNMKNLLSQDGLKSLNPIIPPKVGGGASDFESEFIPMVVRTGRIVPTPDQTGFTIMYRRGLQGFETQLFTKNKKGEAEPVVISVEQLLRSKALPTPVAPPGTVPPVKKSPRGVPMFMPGKRSSEY